MKKRIITSLAILALFALAIAAYAYNQGTTTLSTQASCCKKDGGSCPMKGKGHDDHAQYDGKSCSMKHGSDHGAVGDHHAQAEGHSCCECCGDSCPMKKNGEGTATAVSATEDGKSCCGECECCKAKTERSV